MHQILFEILKQPSIDNFFVVLSLKFENNTYNLYEHALSEDEQITRQIESFPSEIQASNHFHQVLWNIEDILGFTRVADGESINLPSLKNILEEQVELNLKNQKEKPRKLAL